MHLRRLVALLPILLAPLCVAAKEREPEFGSYVNPNNMIYENCGGEQLTQLSVCANDILTKLDDCKPDDLACECCSLQSMEQRCFGLCRHHPSANFLSQLILDCETLSEVNACGLPFKKSDVAEAKISRTNFRAGARKTPVKVEERVKSLVGSSSANKTSGKVLRVNLKSKVPGPIVLNSRIKNNATEDEPLLTEKHIFNSSNATAMNSTTCEESGSANIDVWSKLVFAFLLVGTVSFFSY